MDSSPWGCVQSFMVHRIRRFLKRFNIYIYIWMFAQRFLRKASFIFSFKWSWPLIITYLHKLNKLSASSFCEKASVFTLSYRKALISKFDLRSNISSSTQARVIIWQTMMGWKLRCHIPNLWKYNNRFNIRVLKGFYHTCAWQPSWSCDQHRSNLNEVWML